MHSRLSATWHFIKYAITHPSQWFWPVWAVTTIFVSGLGFWRAEHAIDQVEQEVRDRTAAIVEESRDRAESACEQSKRIRTENEENLANIITRLATNDPTPNPEAVARILAIIHDEYANDPLPPACLPFMSTPANTVVVVDVPPGG